VLVFFIFDKNTVDYDRFSLLKATGLLAQARH
jgi:hypothetical protein